MHKYIFQRRSIKIAIIAFLLSLPLTGCVDNTILTPRVYPAGAPLPGYSGTKLVRPKISRPNPRPTGLSPNLSGLTIVVDPGHGGKDPGCLAGNGVREKDVVLTISQRLARLLRSLGANVLMTRDSDRFIELDNRAALAQRSKTDLLVSIHADSAPNKSADGATVLVGVSASTQSKKAAVAISASFTKAGINCRPSRSQKLRVCDGHSRPAVLVECGFLSNYRDMQNLIASSYQGRIAAAIAHGICDYFAR